MQLILLLALLLFGGAGADGKAENGLKELFEPETVELLKQVSGGDGQVEAFMNEVKEISDIVSAIAPLTRPVKPAGESGDEENRPAAEPKPLDVSEILKPVCNIADDSAYNALARAVRA